MLHLKSTRRLYSTFLDLIKAFDTVPHHLLINKLSDIGLSSFIICWICFYLTDRKQVVVLNACSSAECNVTSGVSQGSACARPTTVPSLHKWIGGSPH